MYLATLLFASDEFCLPCSLASSPFFTSHEVWSSFAGGGWEQPQLGGCLVVSPLPFENKSVIGVGSLRVSRHKWLFSSPKRLTALRLVFVQMGVWGDEQLQKEGSKKGSDMLGIQPWHILVGFRIPYEYYDIYIYIYNIHIYGCICGFEARRPYWCWFRGTRQGKPQFVGVGIPTSPFGGFMNHLIWPTGGLPLVGEGWFEVGSLHNMKQNLNVQFWGHRECGVF